MSWLKKVARDWGQIPFADPSSYLRGPGSYSPENDPYSRKNPASSLPKKKDRMQNSGLGGMGGGQHNQEEVSGDKPNEKQPHDLSSFYNIDALLYDGNLMDEDQTGKVRPRTEFQGGVAGLEPTNHLGIIEDSGPNLIRETPNDKDPREVAITNFLQFQNRPSNMRRRLNREDINIV